MFRSRSFIHGTGVTHHEGQATNPKLCGPRSILKTNSPVTYSPIISVNNVNLQSFAAFAFRPFLVMLFAYLLCIYLFTLYLCVVVFVRV